jgi:hypothetical protein
LTSSDGSKSPVLLAVVDAIGSRVVLPAMERGRLPNLRRMAELGVLRNESTAIFPSITPAATAALVTGASPREHGIAGAYWYERDRDEVAYFGDDFWVIVEKGLPRFVRDFLIKLNFRFLATPTIFQTLAEHGRSATCLNYLWFRGDTEHKINPPWWLRLLPGLSGSDRVNGPKVVALGDVLSSRLPKDGKQLNPASGPGHRLGFDDRSTYELLRQIAERRAMTDFTLAYFPDNDFQSHSAGPHEALATLEQVDEYFGELFKVFGSAEKMLDEWTVIITGDHSQSDLLDDAQQRSIELGPLLDDYEIVPPGEPWSSDDQLMVCPNMRAVQVYFRESSRVEDEGVAQRLLADPRVDQVIVQRVPEEPPTRGREVFRVLTADRGELEFWAAREDSERSEEGSTEGRDLHGNRWRWRGDLQAVDARRSDDGVIEYGEYPNALERIAAGYPDTAGRLWATARPGHEFKLAPTTVHRRGSHGSLHRDDSTSPLLVGGSVSEDLVPEHPRSIDVVPLCFALLGVEVESGAAVRSTG